MSTRETTATYSSGGALTGTPSKVVAFLAVMFAILWSALDINFHGHVQCSTIKAKVMERLKERSHLENYLKPMKDFAGQDETGTVECTCSGGRKIRLDGKVVSDDLKQEFSDVAALAV